jgi:hypothetical protein
MFQENMYKPQKTASSEASGSKIMILPMIILMVLLVFPMVSAVPPVQTTTTDTGLQIAYPQYQFVPANHNFTLYIHVYNSSKYLTGTTADCYLNLYSPSGNEIMHSKMTAGGSDYFIFVNEYNFTSYGSHSFIIQCNTTSQTGFANGIFEVSHAGLELTVGRAVIDIGLLTMFIIFLIGTVILFINFDNLLTRVGMFGFGYLLLIAITFISWNMANDFITSTVFIAEMFRILFFVLVIGAFPLLIGAFAWYVIMLFKIKEIERLMDRGIDRDEAERRGGRKYK